MNDAEILHGLKKFDAEILQILLSDKFCTFSTTTVWCRNSASQPSGWKTLDAEILQISFSAKFDTFTNNNCMMQKFCISA